jgi:hypothetical protein
MIVSNEACVLYVEFEKPLVLRRIRDEVNSWVA